MDWSKWTSANTPRFSFVGLECWARLLNVLDGDTVTVAAEVSPGQVCKISLRLEGIDAPEMTSKVQETKLKAEFARGRLVQILAPDVPIELGKHITRSEMCYLLQKDVNVVFIKCGKMDKYGRVLGKVFNSLEQYAGDLLVQEGHAIPYDGGTKVS